MGSDPQRVERDSEFLRQKFSVIDLSLLFLLVVLQNQFAIVGGQLMHAPLEALILFFDIF
jgi:hypothetical protein